MLSNLNENVSKFCYFIVATNTYMGGGKSGVCKLIYSDCLKLSTKNVILGLNKRSNGTNNPNMPNINVLHQRKLG